MGYEHITVEQDGGVVTATLNRPERLNAMSARMVHELIGLLDATADDDAVKVLLITGAGRGFCSGADLAAHNEAQEPFEQAVSARTVRRTPIGHFGVLFSHLARYPKPVIAAVNGVAAGAGLSLALAADIRWASEEARFISAFVRRALAPDTGVSFHLPHLVGKGRAIEMLLTGDAVDAQQAERWGLVNRLVPGERLLEETTALAQRIANGPSVTIELTKRMVQDQYNEGFERQMQAEGWAVAIAGQTEDVKEGGQAFLQKREPRWQGR